ncbi:MAG: bacteriohemerythrin [Gammaproteobacteria bacterium]|nr:bacteriohemerythrin [Gammaproteobacteria bacterium]
MKDLIWGKVLSVEIDEIDEDHRKLIDIFNILNHALADGESQEYLKAVIDELINCTSWHFSHEERLMLKYGYTDIEQHKEIHRELVQAAKELQDKILMADNTISEDDLMFLERWLTGHILTDDMKLGEYLSQVM